MAGIVLVFLVPLWLVLGKKDIIPFSPVVVANLAFAFGFDSETEDFLARRKRDQVIGCLEVVTACMREGSCGCYCG